MPDPAPERPAPTRNVTISYLDGHIEKIDADRIEWDYDARLFTLFDDSDEAMLIVPFATVRSIRRGDPKAAQP